MIDTNLHGPDAHQGRGESPAQIDGGGIVRGAMLGLGLWCLIATILTAVA